MLQFLDSVLESTEDGIKGMSESIRKGIDGTLEETSNSFTKSDFFQEYIRYKPPNIVVQEEVVEEGKVGFKCIWKSGVCLSKE